MIKIKYPLFLLTFLIVIFFIGGCVDSENSAIKLNKVFEVNFAGKGEATKEIDKLALEYIKTFSYEKPTSFDDRYSMFSSRYIDNCEKLIKYAINAPRSTIEKLTFTEKVQVLKIRKSFDFESIKKLSGKEVLKELDKKYMRFMNGARLEKLIFIEEKLAVGNIKRPVSFLYESGKWKIDPWGEVMHQEMVEKKLASLEKISVDEYRNKILKLAVLEENSWIPLIDRTPQ